MADLNNATYWSETDASNNNASPNGWPEGMMPSGVNDAARADKGALKRFWDRVNPIQYVAPSGGLWTFNTTNTSYPTAYIDGELFSFYAGGVSGAGDYFRVNALAPKPIYVLRNYASDPIKPFDIAAGTRSILAYDASLAAGAGGFILINPLSPLSGNGTAGGGSMSGSLTMASLTLTTSDPSALHIPSGGVNTYSLAVGTGGETINGGLTVNGTGVAVYVPYGHIQTVGNLTVGGSTTSGSISAVGSGTAISAPNGQISTGGNLSVAGTGTFGGALSATSATLSGSGTALNLSGGNLSVSGTIYTASTLTANGGITILSGGLTATGNASVTGTFYAGSTITANGGLAALSGGLTVTGNASISGTATIGGSGTALNLTAGNLVVAGTGSFGGTVTAPTFSGAHSGGTIAGTTGTFSGAVTIAASGTALNLSSGNLVVAGTASFGGLVTMSATGGTALNLSGGNLTVSGTIYTASTLTANGGVTILSGGLTATGNASVTGTASFGGLVTMSATGGTALNLTGGNLIVGGSITTAGNVSATQGVFSYSGGGYALDCTSGSMHVAGSATIGGDIICQNITANVQGFKPAGGSWASISDVRTKEADIADYTRGLAACLALRPVSYRYNGRGGMPRDGRTFVGLVADEALPVMPEMVGTIHARLDPDDAEPTDILTLDTTALTFALLNAVKKLAADVADLKGK